MSVMCLGAVAQSGYFFDMDELVASEGLYLPQNKPNPFNGSTDVYLAVVDGAEVSMVVADVFGSIEAQYVASLEPGVHRLRVTLRAKGTHVLGVNHPVSVRRRIAHSGESSQRNSRPSFHRLRTSSSRSRL